MGSGFNISDVVLVAATVMILRKLASILGATDETIHSSDKPMKVVTPIIDEPKSGFGQFIGSCKQLVHKSKKSFEMEELSPQASVAIDIIKQHDHSFEPRRFVKIVSDAYMNLANAVNSGDLNNIKDLCGEEVCAQLASYIAKNKSRGFMVQQAVVKYNAVDIMGAKRIGGYDYIEVKLQLQIVRMVYNREGELIVGNQGNPSTALEQLMLRRNSAKAKWQIWEIGSVLTSNEIGSA